ncbi:putative nuclease HARBI1 [Sitophilus oryzae]|uniref:Nuclease HARBI1 n=1 Tax=Sitophilus oryzae TaxID=7048 RepID=A0A6J2X7X1_SITOR|nr:putative nuclease HARBI1 [Sitophilus oryzae]
MAAEEEERLEDFRNQNIERPIMRDGSDPFSIEDVRFVELFRLNKDMAQYVYNGIGPNMVQTNNPVAIPSILKFFGVLRFLATGAYQRVIGCGFDISMSQQSISRAVEEVTTTITNTFSEQWINFPTTEASKNNIKQGFMAAFNFPGVIGAVDCTHVEIVRPSMEEHNYLNRKGYHSKNIQLICDHQLKILNINIRYAGATHDAYIWRNSRVREQLERNYERGERNSWLLGDSGYPQEPWLMTPIGNALPNTPEHRYTQAQIRARNSVERCIGVLKGRFLCLSKIMRYSPEKVGNIFNDCGILHNICLNGVLDFDLPLPPPADDPDNNVFNNRGDGHISRQNLIQRYFT